MAWGSPPGASPCSNLIITMRTEPRGQDRQPVEPPASDVHVLPCAHVWLIGDGVPIDAIKVR